MRRTVVLAALAVCFVVGPSRPASAQWWSWMEEYSGPGGFQEMGASFLFTFYCRGRSNTDARDPTGMFEKRLGLASTDARWCLHAETGRFTANVDPEKGYPQVDARTWEFGGSVTVWRAFDVGAGAGLIRFTADPGGLDLTTDKFVFTPVRLVMRPAMLFSNYASNSQRAVASVVKLYFKWTYVAGDLNGADFGAPANTFSEDGEMIASAGLMLDAFELLRALR